MWFRSAPDSCGGLRSANLPYGPGLIVPSGIATDDSIKAYFDTLSRIGRLVSLYDFENREQLFPAVDSCQKFCLLTLGQAVQAEFACFLTHAEHLHDPRRRFTLTPEDIRLLNPNTRTCPVFRGQRDAEITKKIYCNVPVLICETEGEKTSVLPPLWNRLRAAPLLCRPSCRRRCWIL